MPAPGICIPRLDKSLNNMRATCRRRLTNWWLCRALGANDNSLFESDASGVDDLGSRPSYSDEEDEDMDTTYDDEEDSYGEDGKGEEHHAGVLGPLSRKAGGTTGVVLDVESDGSSPSSPRERGYFPSEVSHLTSGDIRVNEKQRILDHGKRRYPSNLLSEEKKISLGDFHLSSRA